MFSHKDRSLRIKSRLLSKIKVVIHSSGSLTPTVFNGSHYKEIRESFTDIDGYIGKTLIAREAI